LIHIEKSTATRGGGPGGESKERVTVYLGLAKKTIAVPPKRPSRGGSKRDGFRFSPNAHEPCFQGLGERRERGQLLLSPRKGNLTGSPGRRQGVEERKIRGNERVGRGEGKGWDVTHLPWILTSESPSLHATNNTSTRTPHVRASEFVHAG